MDTIRTGFVVMLMLAVLYGVYVVLNKNDAPLPAEIAWHQQHATDPLVVDVGSHPDSTPATARTEKSPAKDWAAMGIDGSKIYKAELSPEPEEPETFEPVPTSRIASEPPKPRVGPAPMEQAAARSPITPKSKPLAAPTLLSNSGSDERPGTDGGLRTPLTPLPLLREGTTLPTTDSPAADTSLQPGQPSAPESDSTGALPPLDLIPSTRTDVHSAPAAGGLRVTPEDTLPITEPSPATTVTTPSLFEAALREAQQNLDQQEFFQALFVLSRFQGSPDLSAEQHAQLANMLDPLAAKVIYSPEHHVCDPHEVSRGETLAQIAETYAVPVKLLMNINSIENPEVLVPGTKLKVVRGPFRADVDLTKSELTLFAGELYAGRFPISVGDDPAPAVGEYRVLEKQPGRVYYAGDGQTLAADDQRNPYGRTWLGLDKELSIHGSPETGSAAGCISLSPLDAADVYGILSQGSKVTIRR